MVTRTGVQRQKTQQTVINSTVIPVSGGGIPLILIGHSVTSHIVTVYSILGHIVTGHINM